jgi:hypothetical protein
MTPALLAGEEPGARGSRGLFIGDIEPDVPDDGLIVMLGEAARAWAPGLSEEMRALLKVPTHAMKLVGERAWFGRMVLPESSTTHPMRRGTTAPSTRRFVRARTKGMMMTTSGRPRRVLRRKSRATHLTPRPHRPKDEEF